MVDVTKFSVGDMVTIRAKVSAIEDGSIFVELTNESDVGIVESEIATHEPRTLAQRLAGLTVGQIEAALARKDSALSEAIEAAGTQIARARRDAGDLKRHPKKTGTGDAGATPSARAAVEAHPVPTGDDTPAADPGPEPFGGEVSAYRKAEHFAKQGRKSFDGYVACLTVDEREAVNEFMPELLGIADGVNLPL
jgi:hypothetical protein